MEQDEEMNQEVPREFKPLKRLSLLSKKTLDPHLETEAQHNGQTTPINKNLAEVPNLLKQSSLKNKNSAFPNLKGKLGISSSTTLANNWQSQQSSVKERNALMFNNELLSDITFLVGEEGLVQRIPAHKYVLATGSSVFYAMLYGGLSNESSVIEIPDVEPNAFRSLLRYLYCDEIELNADNVLSTLYAAKKYIVPYLAKECVKYLETSLSAQNACVLLSQSCLFEETDLMQRCWEVIDAQAEEALKSDGFVEIDFTTLNLVLSRETLNAKEVTIFEAATRWAVAECQRRDMEPSASNQRNVLGDALHHLRFPTMTVNEFADTAAQSGILSLEEVKDVFLHFTASKIQCLPTHKFQYKRRRGLIPQRCHRFQSSAYRSNQWRYRGRCDSIQFSVSQRIFICGFALYGSSNGAADYDVTIELKQNGTVLGIRDTMFHSDGSSSTFPVLFQQPIQIEPEKNYTASIILDGSELSFFGQEGMAEVIVGKVTFHFQCSSESTNGTGVQGGQIPELIFYS